MRRNIATHFRHISSPNPLLEIIDEETGRIQRRHPGIEGFKIQLDVPNLRRQRGNQVRAQVSVFAPDLDIIVTKAVDGMEEDDNAIVALRRAFHAASLAVDQHLQKNRGRALMKVPLRLAEVSVVQ